MLGLGGQGTELASDGVSGVPGQIGNPGAAGEQASTQTTNFDQIQTIAGGSTTLATQAETILYLDPEVSMVAEGQTAVINIHRIGDTSTDVTVFYLLTNTTTDMDDLDLSTFADPDVGDTSGRATFTADGPNTIALNIPLVDDGLTEGEESFFVNMTFVTSADVAYGSNNTTVTILDGRSAINGTPGPDTLTGTPEADTFNGFADDDRIILAGGSDTVDGGDGVDTAVFDGDRAGYGIRLSASETLEIVEFTGELGTANLFGVEKLVFNDVEIDLRDFLGGVDLDNDGFRELAEMYAAYFNRAPDAFGLFFWADKLADGLPLSEIAELFFDQPETRGLYPDPSDINTFVTTVYSNVLGRTPDQSGFDFWTGVLERQEVTVGTFVLEVIKGAKVGTSQADRDYLETKTDLGVYYSTILGRSDVLDAVDVFAVLGTQETSDLAGARAAAEQHDLDAQGNPDGEFQFTLVGVVDFPFDEI